MIKHNCTDYGGHDQCSRCLTDVRSDRDAWKRRAESAEASGRKLAAACGLDGWEMHIPEIAGLFAARQERIDALAVMVAELLRLVKYMRPLYHEHTCQEGDAHEATCADAGEALADSEKMEG